LLPSLQQTVLHCSAIYDVYKTKYTVNKKYILEKQIQGTFIFLEWRISKSRRINWYPLKIQGQSCVIQNMNFTNTQLKMH